MLPDHCNLERQSAPHLLPVPAYPVLFAAGSEPWERWLVGVCAQWIKPVYVTLMVLMGNDLNFWSRPRFWNGWPCTVTGAAIAPTPSVARRGGNWTRRSVRLAGSLPVPPSILIESW